MSNASKTITDSFVKVDRESHFPIQNIPFGVFRPVGGGSPRVGIAIGDKVLDLAVLQDAGLLSKNTSGIFSRSSLNSFMALGPKAWRQTRRRIQELLGSENPELRDNAPLRSRAFYSASAVEMLLPVEIGDYTDFYSSREHATNVGTMFRGRENALQPNWLHLPVAYHGRSSSIVISGTDIYRPHGQLKPAGSESPVLEASTMLDFELEMGFFVGQESKLGTSLPLDKASKYIFGMVLVNDWSARDIQRWEYVPLGPFLAKNFATSISPWVVTMDALEPFRVALPDQKPEPLPYLRLSGRQAFDIHLEAYLQSSQMREPHCISRTNFKYMYWSIFQQLTHHTVNGCNVRTGDLMASGTISGPNPDSYGSLLELTWKGEKPLKLPGGETRAFMADGDRITLTGWCEGAGYRIGFGEVTGRLLPAWKQE